MRHYNEKEDVSIIMEENTESAVIIMSIIMEEKRESTVITMKEKRG